LNGEKKNNIGNHREHSTWFNTKSVIQGNNENSFKKKCLINLIFPIMIKRLVKYTRKLPKTKNKYTFRLEKRYPKRRKIEHYQEKFFKNNFIRTFNTENQTIISITDFSTFKIKPESYKTSLLFSILNPGIVLDFD